MEKKKKITDDQLEQAAKILNTPAEKIVIAGLDNTSDFEWNFENPPPKNLDNYNIVIYIIVIYIKDDLYTLIEIFIYEIILFIFVNVNYSDRSRYASINPSSLPSSTPLASRSSYFVRVSLTMVYGCRT